MVLGPEEELISSIKGLHNNAEFSDITIVGSHKEYPVHRAVICPRSTYFAQQCRAILANPSQDEEGHLDLKADDPSALDRVVEYLYTLNYSDASPDISEEPKINGTKEITTNGISKLANGDTERPVTPEAVQESAPEPQQSPREDLADNSLDDFIPAAKQPKTKKKKGKRRQSVPAPPEKSAEPDQEAVVVEPPEPSAAKIDAPAPAPAPPVEELTPPPSPKQNLATHAKVYALSSKYGIDGLQALALDKFETQAQSSWDADDFLAAAKEVYVNTAGRDTLNAKLMGPDGKERSIRDVITVIMHQHSELMDKQEKVAEVGLDFALDMLTHLRARGNWTASDQAVEA